MPLWRQNVRVCISLCVPFKFVWPVQLVSKSQVLGEPDDLSQDECAADRWGECDDGIWQERAQNKVIGWSN